MNQFDKAIYYYKRTEKYGTSKLVFSALNNLGVIFKKKKILIRLFNTSTKQEKTNLTFGIRTII